MMDTLLSPDFWIDALIPPFYALVFAGIWLIAKKYIFMVKASALRYLLAVVAWVLIFRITKFIFEGILSIRLSFEDICKFLVFIAVYYDVSRSNKKLSQTKPVAQIQTVENPVQKEPQ